MKTDATLGQAAKILGLVEQKETSCDQLQRLLGSGLLSDLLEANVDTVDRDAFRRLVGLKPLNIFTVTVNYDLNVEDAVKAGKYNWTNSDVTSKNFPSKRKGAAELEIILVHFNRDMGSDDVLRELDKQGLRPAELPEGLVFGGKYPDIQREFPVIILGSVWRYPIGSRYCACLSRHGSKRNLDLLWLVYRWNGHCRFAAVRK